ncbi:MAG: CehA/McbA family metallohydrolase [Ethanoligenens sp.]
MQSLYDMSGQWYKGNLHMHTTQSDGALSPEEAIDLYRRAGYDFLALTDHWKQSEPVETPGFLQLTGCEFDTGDMNDLQAHPIYHIVGIGMERAVALRRAHDYPPQVLLDAIRETGGVAILAHPAWSLTDPSSVLPFTGLAAAEIFNTFSGVPYSNAHAESSLYFDLWAKDGLLLPCTAADDCHWYKGEQTCSYMMVNAPALTASAIRAAIAAGNFYASQGPRFTDIRYDGETVEVFCSHVQTVVFYSDTVYCNDRLTTADSEPVTSARYAIKPSDRYVRVELIDADGRRAWSKPFAVKKLGR